MIKKTAKIKRSSVRSQADVFRLIEKERSHIFNLVSDFILVVDVKTGMLVDANLTAQRILGKNIDQIRKMNQSEIHKKSEEVKYRQLFKKQIDMGRGILTDVYVINKNKKLIPFDVNIKPIKINKRDYAIGIFRDISKRKKIEDELLNSLSRYQTLSDNNPDFIFVVDKHYRILDLNKSAANLFHRKEEQLIGQPIKSLFPPEISKGYIRSLNKVFKTKKPLIRESQMVVGGHIFYISTNLVPLKDNRNSVYAVLGDVRDLTYRKQAEKELKESREKYQSVFESVSDIIILVDKTGLIVDINGQLEGISGYKPSELIGRHFSTLTKIITKESLKTMVGNFAKRIAGKNIDPYNIKVIGKNGQIIILELNITVRKINGRIMGLIAALKDVTKKILIEENLKEVEKIAGLGSYVLDITTGKWESSEVLDGIFGIDKKYHKTIEGWSKMIHPKHRKEMVDYFTKEVVGQKKPFNKEYKIIRPSDHKERWLYGLGKLELNKRGQPIKMVGTIMDITSRKEIEEELLKQKDKFEKIFDLSPNFIIHKSNDDRFLEVNKAFADFTGLSKEKIIGKSTFDLILDKKVAQATRDDDLEVIKTGQPKFGIIRHFSSPFSKNSIWGMYSKMPFLDLGGKVIGTLTVTNNISKLIESEKEIKRQQEAILNVLDDVKREKNKSEIIANDLKKFKLAVDNASDQIVITDPNGIILHANNATEKITGFKVKDILGKKIGSSGLWGNSKNREFYQKLWKNIEDDKKMFTGELINRHKNGSHYTVLINIAPVLDNKGKIIYFVFIERDITKEKEIDRMKTEFVSIASHQLRTPLTGIKWFLELLLNQKVGILNEKQIDFLNQVTLSNERMISLVSDLLSVSRIETGGKKFEINKRNINIVPIIKSVISDNIALIKEKNIKITSCASKSDKIMIMADPDYIRQTFNNLISNALKYSNNNGKVEIDCKYDGKQIIFFVKDDGAGIPLNEQKRVFEKFFRSSNIITKETGGTGLGLYIAKAIIEGHGGKIWFESEENKGTTFYFSIPKKK